MQLDRFDEVGIGAVAVEHGAVHGEVGRIDLQHEAGLVDRQYSLLISRASAAR